MDTTGQTDPFPAANPGPMTLSRLRHDIRNYLNAIKLSCALLQRRSPDELAAESVREIDRSADGINDLITSYLSDTEAPKLFRKQ